MPETIPTPPQTTPLERLTTPPQLYGLVALILLGCASFLFVFAYLGKSAVPSSAQPAAAAAATADAFANISIEAESAFVYDIAASRVLYEKNADAQLPLASLTKVMLALAVAGELEPDAMITIPYDTAPFVGSAQRLSAGERWRVQDVIDFTLIASSNEGASMLADAADPLVRADYPGAPESSATIWRMNEIGKKLGLHRTYFLNASGLDISATQSGAYGTARDMAILMTYAATSSPALFAATAEGGLRLASPSGGTTSAANTNEALGDIPGLMLGKTGYTDLAGGNLAVVFDVGLAHPVVAVVLGSSRDGRFADMKTLVERAREAVMAQ